MSAVEVPTSEGNYLVEFGTWSTVKESLPERRIVVSDANVAEVATRHGVQADITFPSGEHSKSTAQYLEIIRELGQRRASRLTPIVAVGGGVTGDLVGFAAATYLRGVPLIQVPTTLLAMVDSSVGGKVGVDLPAGKNLLGAFYSPSRVLVPLDALESLPIRQINNGMAEVWKYGFIMSEEFLAQLDANPIRKPGDVPEDIIRKCVEFKRDVVASDFKETTGLRAILNFGHTIGHAIEKLLNYEELLHGEAISIGMVMEGRLGELVGFTAPGTADAVAERMVSQGLPIDHPITQKADELIDAMRGDKKSEDGKLAFSLVPKLGACRLVPEIAESDVRAALKL